MILETRKDSILYDESGVPWCVQTPAQLNAIRKSLETILACEKNKIFELLLRDTRYHCTALLQLYCLELLLAMEANKYKKAHHLYITILQHRSGLDERAVIINNALHDLINRAHSAAVNRFQNLLCTNPKDIFAFYAAHMIEFLNGWTTSMLDTLQIVSKHWQEGDRFYTYVKGIEAFILHENLVYEQSFAAAQEAIRINPRNIYALHALCHHYYDTKKYAQGLCFMDRQRKGWSTNYGMRMHLQWHYALFAYQLKCYEDVEKSYQLIRNKNSPEALEDLDAAALLFRIHLNPLMCQSFELEADALLSAWDRPEELGFYFFNDFHAALVFAINKRHDLIDFLIEHAAQSYPTRCLTKKLILLEALKHYSLNQFAEVENLLNKEHNFRFMGGSRAQRQIINELLEYAKGQQDAARAK